MIKSKIAKTLENMEFNNQLLLELQMKPNQLLSQVANDESIKIGIEYEMAIDIGQTVVDDEYRRSDFDWDADDSLQSLRGAIEFFHKDNRTKVRDVCYEFATHHENWDEWLMDRIEKEIEDEYQSQLNDIEDEDERYDFEQSRDDFFDDYRSSYSVSMDDVDDFFRNEWPNASEVFNYSIEELSSSLELTWPHMIGDGISFDDAREIAAEKLQELLGKEVGTGMYGSASKKGYRIYNLETDSSIEVEDDDQLPGELVSPPQTYQETVTDFMKIHNWARTNAVTNDSTGLHVNMSIDGFENIDWFKAMLFLGDQHVLNQFGREANNFARSTLGKFTSDVWTQGWQSFTGASEQDFEKDVSKFVDQMNIVAKDLMQRSKYQSMHLKNSWIEFRSPGGDWKRQDPKTILSTLARFAIVLKVASDPQAYKREYYKKIYQLLSQTGFDWDNDDKEDKVSGFVDKLKSRLIRLQPSMRMQAQIDDWYKAERLLRDKPSRKTLTQAANIIAKLEREKDQSRG